MYYRTRWLRKWRDLTPEGAAMIDLTGGRKRYGSPFKKGDVVKLIKDQRGKVEGESFPATQGCIPLRVGQRCEVMEDQDSWSNHYIKAVIAGVVVITYVNYKDLEYAFVEGDNATES